MKLRETDFGNVLGASGVQGFFGEGYWFHKFWKYLGGNLSGMTFVSKTATLKPRKGNVESSFLEMIFPSWVQIKFGLGTAVNAMGLPNPGIETLLGKSAWQARKKPLIISIACVADTLQGRLDELRAIIDLIGSCKNQFQSPFALQINLSCPNTGHNLSEIIKESVKALDIASILGVALMPKYSIASAPVEAIMQLNDCPHCDAICVSNTIPFGWTGLNWNKAWGNSRSPLKTLGGGGLSGKALCPLVCEWILRLRQAGFAKPINGGGGILSCKDVNRYHNAGTSSIFLGSVAILRPWRIQGIISHANTLEWR